MLCDYRFYMVWSMIQLSDTIVSKFFVSICNVMLTSFRLLVWSIYKTSMIIGIYNLALMYALYHCVYIFYMQWLTVVNYLSKLKSFITSVMFAINDVLLEAYTFLSIILCCQRAFFCLSLWWWKKVWWHSQYRVVSARHDFNVVLTGKINTLLWYTYHLLYCFSP